MANMFKYSIIRAEPDMRRGERVNVGIAIENGDSLDVRVIDTRKATTIASKDWDAHIQLFSDTLRDFYGAECDLESVSKLIGDLDRQLGLTATGWFEAANPDAYEAQVSQVVAALVARPKAVRKSRETSLATEVANSFKSADILSVHGEPLESGKVVRNYVVDPDANLVADFALKNGSLHFATTLSLTASNPHIGTSASKAITMDKARRITNSARAYCVYAVAPSREPELREHISLLKDYSDAIFNWRDPDEQLSFKRLFFDAYSSNFPTEIETRAN
ncbi:MAG: DUF3037 domain-containing protein [Pseudomonadota bacterium]